MKMLKRIIASPYLVWMLLSIPAVPMLISVANGAQLERLLHPSGEFSARFLIISLAATPLRMLFPHAAFARWLVKTRRYFGVAAFFYALLHTIFYIIDEGSLRAILNEFTEFGIWTGWAAFAIFIPLAITSNDYSIRKLLRSWKPLQRFVYAAAVLTLLHWIFIEDSIGGAMVHFVPLAGLEIYRIWKIYGFGRRNRPTEKAA